MGFGLGVSCLVWPFGGFWCGRFVFGLALWWVLVWTFRVWSGPLVGFGVDVSCLVWPFLKPHFPHPSSLFREKKISFPLAIHGEGIGGRS